MNANDVFEILAFLVITTLLIKLVAYSQKMNPGKVLPAVTFAKHPYVVSIYIFVVCLLYFGIYKLVVYNNAHEEMRKKQTAALPHTALIKGYALTLPKAIPDGYFGGHIERAYFKDLNEDDSVGPEGISHLAKWSIYLPGGQFGSEIQGGIDFMLNEKCKPGCLADEWQEPYGWSNIVRTVIGTEKIAGISFTVNKCIYDLYPGYDVEIVEKDGVVTRKYKGKGVKSFALEYLAHDKGNAIGIRGFNCGDEQNTITLTKTAAQTFHKVADGAYPKNNSKIDPHLIASSEDPEIQMIKP